MDFKFFTKKNLLPFYCLFLGAYLQIHAQEAVPFTPRLNGGNIEIRGDIIFVGNNILNRATESNPAQANTPYNGSQNNNSLWMEYIDIDSDPTTFSSSSAELNVPDPACSQVRYAGLYWAATYPNERSTNGGAPFDGTPRIEDWFNIKFQIPGGTYVDLTADTAADPAGQEDDIIFDGYDYTNINNSFKDSPYICYKNVTDLVRSNTNPNGEYTVANVRATKGRRNGSSSAGWVLVIIYENPNESGKFISTFDGYAGMSGSVGNVEVDVDGFRTLPAPFPVRARIGVGALEGDRGIRNDRFFIRADMNAGNPFTNLSTGNNPANNFFNSTITVDGNQVPTRTPYGTNTLGTDLDLFNLNNPSNSVIPNGESGATLRFTSTGDGYGAFLATFSVEIIEPNIVLEKRVEDIGGNDITGMGVNLGQTLDYVLSFRNLGNDDASGYTIRDLLPVNTTFVSVDLSGAPGVSHSLSPDGREVFFNIPDNLVEIGDPVYSIRLRVTVAENCFDFVDACTDLIENLGYSTYQGVINGATITDDPSVSDFDNCGFVTPGATNFLLDDLSDCNFTRTVQLCGDNVLLDAGDGFDAYVWVRDDNGNGQLDPTDTVLDDGDPDNDPSTLLVDDIGTYIVDKQVADPCKGFKEIIHVERFGTTQTNPIVDYFNALNGDADPTNDIQGEIVQCSIDGDLLPKIFLCGSNDSQLLQINITDAQSLIWEQLDEGSCTAAPDDCANKNLTCTWNQVGTGNNFTANAAGKYRLVINYQNGCFSRFYFDVFQNNLDIQYNTRDIVCSSNGNITITNLGATYGYQLVDDANNTIITPFSAGQGPSFDFTSGQNGSYRVEVVQLDVAGDPIPGACIFSTPPIGILDRDFQVDIDVTPANCNAQGTIEIDVLNVLPNYSYVLRRDDGTLIDDETAQPDNTHTFTVNPGDYIIETSTDDGCFDSQNITVGRVPDPTLSALTTADIGCSAGIIELTRTGGQGNPDFVYAIWSKDGTLIHHPGGSPTEQQIVDNIDPNAFQTESTFYFGWRDDDGDGTDEYIPGEDGDYQFIVIDANNCYAISSPVTINDNGTMTASVPTPVDVSCSGGTDGEITIVAANGIPPYQYSMDGGTTFVTNATFVNLSAGDYNLVVQDSSGCEVAFTQTINEPFPLSASAGVSRDATCDPNGAEVRVTNVTGGTAPFEYSFDGGASYGASSIAVLPPGNYTVVVRDANQCTFPMAVTVENEPMPPVVTLTPAVDYNCNGTGNITATPDVATYDYTYELDGVPNTPPTSNVFPNVAPGTYTVRTYYTSQTPPTPSLLLTEDFGAGATIPSPNTIGYNYEDQTNNPPGDANNRINDFEYSVTSQIVAPFGSWLSPIDHTTGTTASQGRYLVMNVGTPTPTQVIYSKQINDVIPNQDLTVSLYVMNLLRQGTSGLDPDLTIEIREVGTGTVVQSIRTGIIPKNTGPSDWIPFTGTLNPGSNTSLEFVIRSEITGNGGNDFALDDIEIYQVPEVCSQFVETPVTVVAGNVFAASITASTNVSCNGLADGTISFAVEHYDSAAGYDYSLDGGTTWINETSPTFTTAAIFNAGTHRIDIRKADDTSCTTFVEETITEPAAVLANATITTSMTCTNGGATITAGASGGTPTYTYQLEDDLGNIIGTYDFITNASNTVFSGLTAGNYVVRARDANNCEDAIDAALVVAPTNPVSFDLTLIPSCYQGDNSAQIQVDITDGNGNYELSINGGPWMGPPSVDSDTHLFQNLTSGTHTINVRDGLGCIGTPQNLIIEPVLNATMDVTDLSVCSNGNITVNATGGTGPYSYAFVTNGSTVVSADFGASNSFTVTTGNDGAYDVYVRDNNGTSPFCEYMETVTVNPATPLTITATPTDPQCHDGTGNIEVDITSGEAPFTIEIIDLDNGGASNQTDTNVTVNNRTYYNLGTGNYTIQVTDANGCLVTETPVLINNPDELTADIEPILPSGCTGVPNDFGFRFINYPLTLGTLEFSADGGTTWQSGNEFRGPLYQSGTEVFPVIRTVDGGGATVCREDFPRYTIPYPLDDLDITIAAIVIDCNELQVTVQGTRGLAPYEYAYSDDPANFNPATATWTAQTPGNHVFTGLVPGRTYVFYVRDDSPCVRQSSVNVNDVAPPPVTVVGDVTPTCNGANNGSITYTVTETTLGELGGTFDWDLFEITNPTTSINSGTVGGFTSGDSFTVPVAPLAGLVPGEYFVEIRGAAPNNCIIGSENVLVEELDPISGTPNVLRHISCASPGLVEIQSIFGGGGTYTYTLTSTNFTAPIVTGDNPAEVPIGLLVDATTTPFNIDVSVTDQYGCTNPLGTVSMDISQNPNITAVTVSNCATPFSITVNAAGGTAPYLYSMDGGVNYLNNGGIFNNVAVGSYTISIIDSSGCTDTATAEVYPVLQAEANLTTLKDCEVGVAGNAEITIEVLNGSGGTAIGNYDYEVTGPSVASSQVRTNLTANPFNWNGASEVGNYTVLVYDNALPACPPRSFTINVAAEQYPNLNIDAFTHETCENSDDGTITVSAVDNGTGPFTFEITHLNGTPLGTPIPSTTGPGFVGNFTGLQGTAAGNNYTITATSLNSCTATIDQLITEPDVISVNAIVPVQYGCTSGNNTDNATLTFAGASGRLPSEFVRFEFIRDGMVVQDGTNQTYAETDLAGGTYIINIYDANGCMGSTAAVIQPFVEISDPLITNTVDVTCSPGDDAQIEVGVTVNPGTATPNLEYTVTGMNIAYNQTVTATTNNPETFTGLGVGNYQVSITNLDTGCVLETVHTIEDPDVIDVIATKLTDEECLNNGVDDGSFDIAVSNYTGTYDYQVFDSNNNPVVGVGFNGSGDTATPLTISNLPGGVYYIRITETQAPFCTEDSNRITITAPNAPIAALINEEANVTCSNDQGAILVDPVGGFGPYTIILDNTTIGNSYTQNNVEAFVFSGLSAGVFDITITDTMGCVHTGNITLVRPDDIVASISSTPLACYNGNTGSVSASVGPRTSPATPVYGYQLNRYDDLAGTNLLQTSSEQSSPSFAGLSVGFYSITVTDDVDCSDETAIVEISNPTEVEAILVRINPLTCTTGVEFELSATGGSGTYEYSTDNSTFLPMAGNSVGIPNGSITGPLGAGTYQYFVRDAINGCTAVATNEIEEDVIIPLSLTVDTTAAYVNCTGESTASIFAEADGGLGNYRFELYSDYNGTTLNPADLLDGPKPNGEFIGLAAGIYWVNVFSEDCVAAPERVEIMEPQSLTYTEDVVDVSCFGEDNGSITVTLSGGAGGYQYAISPNLDQFDTENTFTDLAPGDYTVIAQDQNGCFELLEYTISEPALLETTATATPEVCAGEMNGIIDLDIQGGTAPYSTRLSNETNFVQDRVSITNLAAGAYIIFVRDANGCEINTTAIVEAGANLNAVVTPVYECTGDTPNNYVNITLEDSSVLGDILYALDSTDPNDMQLNPDFRDIPPGDHYIAIAHTNGCVLTVDFEVEGFEPLTLALEQNNINEITAIADGGLENYTFYFGDSDNGTDNTFYINRTDTYTVRVVDQNGCEATADIFMEFIDIEIPNFFTPDGDGLNDFWTPRNQEAFPQILTIIFDRYGREVYRMGLNDNPWDGLYQQNELPTGDYWYIIKLQGETDDREFIGHFTLYR